MRIAIVTFEYEGITKNGGVGTAYRRLADLLQQDGHSLSIVFLPYLDLPAKKIERKFSRQIEQLRRSGISFVVPNFFELKKLYSKDSFIVARSQAVYEYLKNENFDIVHGADTGALLYRCLGAKLGGKEFQKTKFILGAHGSSLWTSIANQAYTASDLKLAAYDKSSMELADLTISPSKYMQKFLHDKKWRKSKDIKVIPNVNSFNGENKLVDSSGKIPTIQSLIFFGRLEKRKGLDVFIEAVLLLMKSRKHSGIKEICFLGSIPRSQSKKELVAQIRYKFEKHARDVSVRFITNKNAAEARTFLKKKSEALVCLPSLVDNSPYTVIEAIEDGLNFICADSGGQREIIAPQNYRQVLFSPSGPALQKKIEESLRISIPSVEPSHLVKNANKGWRTLHEKKLNLPTRATKSNPKISIFIGLFSDPTSEELVNSYASVLSQNYKNIEIWVPEGFRWHLAGKNRFHLNTFKGKTIYEKAKGATGKYLLFLDGVQLYDHNSLATIIPSMEEVSRKNKKLICYTADTKIKVGKSEKVDSLRPYSRELFFAACPVANSQSIWNTKIFLRYIKKHAAMPRSEMHLHSFCHQLVEEGWEFSMIPLLCFWDKLDQSLRNKVEEDFLMKNSFRGSHSNS